MAICTAALQQGQDQLSDRRQGLKSSQVGDRSVHIARGKSMSCSFLRYRRLLFLGVSKDSDVAGAVDMIRYQEGVGGFWGTSEGD